MPTFPQKIILTNFQREVIMHRLEHLWGLHVLDVAELFEAEEGAPQMDSVRLVDAIEHLYTFFQTHSGHLVSVQVENVEQGEILAECLEGSTYFATYIKGDSVYRHAAKSAAELLAVVLDRDVEAHIDPIPRFPVPPSATHG